MFKLLLFIVTLKLAVVESSCTDFGLEDVESETMRKLQMFGFRNSNELCVFENQYIAVKNDQVLPTCVGYSAPPYLELCDSSTIVCCGSGSAQYTYGYPGSHKECLDEAFAQDSRRHPDCPVEIPPNASSTTHAPSFSPSLTPTHTPTRLPSMLPSIASIAVTLTLVNVDGHQLAKAENVHLLLIGIQQIFPEVETINILQVEQFVEFSVLIVDVYPPMFLSPEHQSQLTDWLLEQQSSLAIRQPEQTTQAETNYLLIILLAVCAFLLMCVLCCVWWNVSSKEDDDAKVVVDMVEYIDTNAVMHSPGRLVACSPGRIAPAAVGGDVLNPNYLHGGGPEGRYRQRWTMEGILPNLPEEKNADLPDPGSYFPTTPTNHLSPKTRTSDSLPSVQTDSYVTFVPSSWKCNKQKSCTIYN